MQYQPHPLLERIWPSRSVPHNDQGLRFAVLQVLIAAAIAVAAGPEVIAAMEMTTLLEMLGASLFLTAFGAGVKLMAIELWRALPNIVLPAAEMTVMRSGAPRRVKALTSIYVAGHAACCLALAFTTAAFVHHVVRLVV